MQTFDAIIFDFDGTLFQTEKLVVYAFEQTFKRLEEEGIYNGVNPSESQMLSVIGNTEKELWQKLLPEYPEEVRQKANDYLLNYELAGVKEGYGALYPDVVDTLIKLKKITVYNKKIKIYFLRNRLIALITLSNTVSSTSYTSTCINELTFWFKFFFLFLFLFLC